MSALLLGNEPQDLSPISVGHDVERAVRTFVYPSNPAIELGQQALFGDDALAVQHEADEIAADQG